MAAASDFKTKPDYFLGKVATALELLERNRAPKNADKMPQTLRQPLAEFFNAHEYSQDNKLAKAVLQSVLTTFRRVDAPAAWRIDAIRIAAGRISEERKLIAIREMLKTARALGPSGGAQAAEAAYRMAIHERASLWPSPQNKEKIYARQEKVALALWKKQVKALPVQEQFAAAASAAGANDERKENLRHAALQKAGVRLLVKFGEAAASGKTQIQPVQLIAGARRVLDNREDPAAPALTAALGILNRIAQKSLKDLAKSAEGGIGLSDGLTAARTAGFYAPENSAAEKRAVTAWKNLANYLPLEDQPAEVAKITGYAAAPYFYQRERALWKATAGMETGPVTQTGPAISLADFQQRFPKAMKPR